MNLSREPLRANVELKARIDDRDAAIEIARGLGAEDQGEEEQEDTYFSLGRYRLKLRESSTGNHWLIGYSRPDGPDARKSQYRLSPVKDPSGMRFLMTKQWGVKVVVRKWRRVFLWEGRVRIHIDRVETLGDFLEFEAVLPVEDADAEAETDGVDYDNATYDECSALLDVARLQHDFGIQDRDLVSSSYSTLIQQSREIPSGT
jgi:predicted adenylyl cyclase CyaB